MTIERMEHVGIVVDDLVAATEFFVELGLELQGDGTVEGRWVYRVVGLEGVRVDFAMMKTPDGNGGLELVKSTRRQTRATIGTPRRTRGYPPHRIRGRGHRHRRRRPASPRR